MNVKHGMCHTPEYHVWANMKRRCYNKNRPEYHYYGGRGIKMLKRWYHSFEVFLADMGPRPSSQHVIDRNDNDGHYTAKNCCWVTRKASQRNTRANHMLTYKGRTMCITEWSEQTGISYKAIECRVKRLGWSVERALTTSPQYRPAKEMKCL